MENTGAPPGWYDDGSGRFRWFDGENWTDKYLPAASTPPPPPRPGTAYHPKMDAAAAPSLQPKKNDGWGWGCVGCIALPALAITFALLSGAFNSDREDDYNNEVIAISQCEDRVKSLLKAPATAQFNSEASGYGTWKVTGSVDSQNSFGAMVRSYFQCTVKISGDTATTKVDFLE